MKEPRKILLFKEMLSGLLILTVLFGTSSCSNPQKIKEYKNVTLDSKNSEKDVQFLVNAAEINLKGIHLGLLAQQKSVMVDVKELGRMMEKMHRNSLKSLSALATKKLVIVPTVPSMCTRECYENLNENSGINFDKEYCEKMVSVHEDTIVMFEKVYIESNDVDIREWAVSILPLLRKHLNHAITCQKACNKML